MKPPSALAAPLPEDPDEAIANQRRQEIITASRPEDGAPRVEVVAMLANRIEPVRPKWPPTSTTADER